MDTIVVESLADFRNLAPAWDDLWLRSDLTYPSARAELIAQSIENFAPGSTFRAILIKQGEHLVGGIPLLHSSVYGLFSLGVLPRSGWSSNGTLLLDRDCQADEVLDRMLDAMEKLPWRLLLLDQVNIDRSCWIQLAAAAERRHTFVDIARRGRIGWLEIPTDWPAYVQSWSKNHRRHMTRARRNLEQYGDYQLRVVANLDPASVRAVMQTCFEIEDSGWKGEAGTSMLRTPGMCDFYLRQAEQLARWGQLLIAFLDVGGKPIAFDYGWLAKGVYHSRKVGYDPQFKTASPGQLLLMHLMEHIAKEGVVRAIDCMGPLDDAMRCWRPSTYPMGRVVMATRGRFWRTAYAGYLRLWRGIRLRKLLGRRRGHRSPQLAQARRRPMA